MTFNYTERVDFLHRIEVDTEDEELFENIVEDIAEEMYAGCLLYTSCQGQKRVVKSALFY